MASLAFIGGVQANISHSIDNRTNPFNPFNWNWNSAGTYIGIVQGAFKGTGLTLSVSGMLTNGALHAAGNVLLNGITNFTENRAFFSHWVWSAASGFLEGAIEGYGLSKENGKNYWWGGETKYNRTQWSFVNTDKPDFIINMPAGNGGNKNPNDCVQTTLYEIDQVKNGGHTYENFHERIESMYSEEGTKISTEDIKSLLNEYFHAEDITRQPYMLFKPEFMKEVAMANDVITVHFGAPGHLDNIRTLRVFLRKPELNTITFRQRLFRANSVQFNYQNRVLGIFRVR